MFDLTVIAFFQKYTTVMQRIGVVCDILSGCFRILFERSDSLREMNYVSGR
jgi:hypothetical protein